MTKSVNEVVGEYVRSDAFKSLAYSSQRQYSQALEHFELRFRSRDIKRIKRSEINTLLQELQATPAMANRMARVISVLFSYAIDHNYVSANPTSRLKKMKTGSWAKWSLDEVQKVIALKDRVVSTAVALAWYTGQRESDVLRMRWDSISNGTISVRQFKTDKVVLIKIHPDLAQYLKTIEHVGSYIVSGDEPMSKARFRKKFMSKIAEVGLEHRVFYGIHKGFASSLVDAGAPNINENDAKLIGTPPQSD